MSSRRRSRSSSGKSSRSSRSRSSGGMGRISGVGLASWRWCEDSQALRCPRCPLDHCCHPTR